MATELGSRIDGTGSRVTHLTAVLSNKGMQQTRSASVGNRGPRS